MATLSAGSLNDGPSLAAGLDCEQTRCPMTHSDPLNKNHDNANKAQYLL